MICWNTLRSSVHAEALVTAGSIREAMMGEVYRGSEQSLMWDNTWLNTSMQIYIHNHFETIWLKNIQKPKNLLTRSRLGNTMKE